MTDHDPMCRAAELGVEDTERCDCDLIAKARAAVGERIAQAIENDRDAIGTKDSAWDDGWCHGMESAARIAREGAPRDRP